MLNASLYIIACSTKNRIRMRLRRLREPRYLAGAVVGAAYLYFSFFARLSTRSPRSRAVRARRGARTSPLTAVPGLAAAAPAFAGIALLGGAALSWVAPFESSLLEFSEAETQFLFPAPVTRRQLLVHRLLRSQLGMLFGAVIFGIMLPSSGDRRLWIGIAMWVLLVTSKVYFTAVSLTRARIRAAAGARNALALAPPAIVVAAVAIVGGSLMQAFYAEPPSSLADVAALVAGAAAQPLARVVLWPFVALARPVFAASAAAYLQALAGALLVLAAATAWMVRSDETLHAAVDEAARRRSRRPQGRQQVAYRARAEGWKLAPAGRPEGALAWKALMQTLRVFDRREAVRLMIVLGTLTTIATLSGGSGPAAALGGFSIAATLFAILMAPQIVRIDLRQDLQHLEVLKTWPVRASAVVRGELVWPAAMITAIAWTMIVVALALSGAVVPRIGWMWRVGIGSAAFILAPALVLAQLTVHNAVALLFPAWVPLGGQRARGLDAIGQRIIMLGGTWLLLAVMAIPGALAAAIFWFAAGRLFGPLMLVPAAAIAAGVIAAEVLVATEALGPVYDRLDILAVERSE